MAKNRSLLRGVSSTTGFVFSLSTGFNSNARRVRAEADEGIIMKQQAGSEALFVSQQNRISVPLIAAENDGFLPHPHLPSSSR
jgi:hypothetical protein